MKQHSKVHNWSRYPTIDAQVYTFRTVDELQQLTRSFPKLIARGTGLSYGDASLGPVILSTLRFNKILTFDKKNGIIRCESGVTLNEILQVIVPAGWFLPVTPGTKYITVGGAVAADVHGKNHHKDGSFCRYVKDIDLLLASGKIMACSRTENEEAFHLTCGGMGLSGIILEVEFSLKKIETSFIAQRDIPAQNLGELIRILKENNPSTYSVAWIDCIASGNKLGRGIVMLGEHAAAADLPNDLRSKCLKVHHSANLRMPINLPSFTLNGISVGAFNFSYYHWHRLSRNKFTTHYDSFFYPLDSIKEWNRLYGKKGFLQYQFVIPLSAGEVGLPEIIKKISQSRLASFLGVLKLLCSSEHPLSFAMEGYTLALDFPISNRLFTLLDELDDLVLKFGGRIYLAKDARMKMETFKQGYPKHNGFKEMLSEINDDWKFESNLARRLSITGSL